MKAVCIKKPLDIGMIELPEPKCAEGEALIEIKAVSICGSDVAAYRYLHPLVKYPRIIGHETAGIVLQIGENKRGIKRGDRVLLEPYLSCGTCYPCSQGRTNCCESLKVLGMQTDGTMREFYAHPANLLHKIPDNIQWEHAPLAEPISIALHSIHRVAPKKGEHVTVIGAGAIGIMAGLLAKIYGAAPIIVDVDAGRLEIARSCGISHALNEGKENVHEKICDITKGRMSETVIEASGTGPGIANALRYASYTGRIALVGWPNQEVSLNTLQITLKELEIAGSRTSLNDLPECLELISTGKIDMSKFVNEVISFDRLPDAVRNLADYPSRYLKIVALR
ncbi:MAG TPA: alcohol dehydrogenase catalytic domain-containing protein [Anaerovoracaceae bacterium]|nr:alcohol dehydrogenase catalytic domain-containing protein [Anaerovoracaceae bacterium]